MNNLEELFPENLYHTYIIEGEIDFTVPLLREFLLSRGHKDFLQENYDSFTIADSAKIKQWHSEMATTNGKRICILSTKFINREAERALLKMLEEPAIDTHFFIVVPNTNLLLDTIRSRAHIIRLNNNENNLQLKNAKTFLSTSIDQRLDIVAKMIEESKDEETSGGIRYRATDLINGLEQLFHEKFKNDKNNNEIQFILKELEKSRDYLSISGSSVKMILEHIALVL